ncbi:MAG TPA: PEP-utilizing enzyme, partial [Actinomycetes bacterium]|nr:PEP-utilizing enzyme [Actinomycetes bacterium]
MAESLSGIGVSPGVAAGPVAQMAPPPVVPTDAAPSGDPEAENQAAMAAMKAVATTLEERAARAPGEAASVLAAQAMMAEDPTLASKVTDGVQAGKAAVTAVVDAFEEFRAMLAAAGPYMAERVADLDDLRNRTIATLLGVPMPGVPDPGHPFVLVALDLAPADTATLDAERVRAIITEEGGPTSHTAILAKSLGIPAVVTCHGATAIPEGETVLVDGTEGSVVVAPDEATVTEALDAEQQKLAALQAVSGPGRTSDGHPVQLLVNIAGDKDLAPADTARLDPAMVLALVTRRGGPTSHTAILARSLGLPAVVACPGALDLADG